MLYPINGQIKESLMDSNREHKSTVVKMEQKFFEEKVFIYFSISYFF